MEKLIKKPEPPTVQQLLHQFTHHVAQALGILLSISQTISENPQKPGHVHDVTLKIVARRPPVSRDECNSWKQSEKSRKVSIATQRAVRRWNECYEEVDESEAIRTNTNTPRKVPNKIQLRFIGINSVAKNFQSANRPCSRPLSFFEVFIARFQKV